MYLSRALRLQRPFPGEAPRVGFVKLSVLVVLLPDGIRDHIVESLEPCAFYCKMGLPEVSPWGEKGIRIVVLEHIHLGDSQRNAVQFLAVDSRRPGLLLRMALLKRRRFT